MELLSTFIDSLYLTVKRMMSKTVLLLICAVLLCSACNTAPPPSGNLKDSLPPDPAALKMIENALGMELPAGIRSLGMKETEFEELSSGTIYHCVSDLSYHDCHTYLLIETAGTQEEKIIAGIVYRITLKKNHEIITDTIVSWFEELSEFYGKPDTYEGMQTDRINPQNAEQFAKEALSPGNSQSQLYDEWLEEGLRIAVQVMKVDDQIFIQTIISKRNP